ncbi:MAG: serine/threonine protein phosphatase [Candidatus Tectomicrobia bacterium]|uniref:Serine/threonine protein phosphatase n=1 Tax=Tectimicrobiota bacterium TaxID=2528274 RepID=A0A932HZN4_UNCTE|nr:serine/threonine protein phosphatase [Candidatus Tectomicrobia bacterium]
MPNLYAIGDIHGQRAMLEELIRRVPFQPEDEIVFIGDFIDRGPDPKGVVDRVLEFKLRHPKTVCLRGNHEDMFLDFLRQQGRYEPNVFMMNGGLPTLESYGLDPRHRPLRLPPLHQQFYQDLKYCHEAGGFLFVHAGLRPGVPLEDQNPFDMLWLRHEFFEAEHDFGRPVVFGHTPMPEILDRLPRLLGIDTGAAYGNKLTCVRLGNKEILGLHQVHVSEAGG